MLEIILRLSDLCEILKHFNNNSLCWKLPKEKKEREINRIYRNREWKRIEQFKTIDGGGEQTSDYNYKRYPIYSEWTYHINVNVNENIKKKNFLILHESKNTVFTSLSAIYYPTFFGYIHLKKEIIVPCIAYVLSKSVYAH